MDRTALRVVERFKIGTTVVRAPRFLDTTTMASSLDRFEFVMQFTAWRTRDKRGRDLCGGLQVQKLSDGRWRVGYPNVAETGSWQDYKDARMAFEHVRRTGASTYTNEAENLRGRILE